ncbi:SpoIIE family protein phosphatase [Streptomyces marincola]|uniref:SpoIIE family protein phosphatase n=1 Tax=Streptomyces marincola TaxID=2878388 RepID=UPI001CF18D96|nr:SpoIIE family protein phosphatase [Streptomyces marincola]UCM90254.1 SpoIIE family protein phosphatase [Streptomyces marincola]
MAESQPVDPGALRAAFEGMGAGLILTDRDGMIEAVNPHAELLLGRPGRTVVGRDFHELLHRRADGSLGPRAECPLWAVVEEERIARVETDSFLRGDGSLLPVSWWGAPVMADGEATGVATLFGGVDEQDEARNHQAAHLAAMEDLAQRLALVQEITDVLTQTLEAEEALNRLGRLLVPRLGEWVTVDLREGEEDVRRVAVVGPQGRAGDEDSGYGQSTRIPESASTVLVRVLRRNEALLMSRAEIAAPPESPGAIVHGFLHTLGAVSAAVVPLSTPRQVVGALTVARTDPERPFREDELPLIRDIGRRAGLAIDNARLFERQRDIAAMMQRHLLPALPDIEPLRLAARYQPAPRGSQVGGDWYDALVLPDGATALAVGDVVGHDLTAAAGMAQLRNMLRVLAWDRPEPPSAIMGRLDDAMSDTTDVPMATLLLARIEPAEDAAPGVCWQMCWTSAGHPPPLLVTDDGHAHYLDQGQDLLLGVLQETHVARRDGVEPLPPGSTVLLYTDGLVELSDSDLDSGLNRLRRHAIALAGSPPDEFCAQLLSRMPPGGSDDIVLLALRVPDSG